ncbi:Otolin-1-A [Merluccius polli]|uniref:Otolin-1-A n=1 Tax=Merluccius polli TaxID=89951 RepID=A0AA47N2I1_MERPO|nr:Otolin-1-A [Merluccius polli]
MRIIYCHLVLFTVVVIIMAPCFDAKTTAKPKYQYTKKPIPQVTTRSPLTTSTPKTLLKVVESKPIHPAQLYPVAITERAPYPRDVIPDAGNENYTLDYNECYFNFCECCPPERGPRGLKGDRGLAGDKGEPGPSGLPGPQGLKGSVGLKGDKGKYDIELKVIKEMLGVAGIPGIPGKPGEKGIYFDGCELCKTCDNLTQSEGGSNGQKGEVGLQGFQGDTGEKGEHGLNGTADKGEPGNEGPTGPPGLAGEIGHKGDKGDRGECGTFGERGNKGDRGDPGHPGIPGGMGHPGLNGKYGPPGQPGVRGDPGPPGPHGEPGVKGPQGTPGMRGLFGPKGDRGYHGMRGERGQRGLKGAKGAGVPQKRSAFSVGISPSKSFPPSGFPVRFDKVFYNEESHYNASSHSFTCVHAGVYVFSYHITVRNRPLRAALVVNGSRRVRTRDSLYGQDIDQASTLLLLRLAAGDQVWLETMRDWNGAYASSEDDSIFSGFLLYSDEA